MAQTRYTEIEYDEKTGATIYSDVDISFKAHPVTGDIIKTKNATVIKQSMRQILQTRANERLGHPEIGAGVQELLFEPMNQLTENRLVRKIADSLRMLEPRATIRDIIVMGDPDKNAYRIKIIFTMLGQQTDEIFETYTYR
jgi:phage baseplate assembly protein W